MITLIFFIVFGYFVMKYQRPLVFAAIYTGVALIIPIVMGAPFKPLIISSALIFIYTSFIYFLLDRFGEGIFLPLAILLGGAILLFLAPLLF